MRVIELFGGIGAVSKALKKLRYDFTNKNIIDMVEIDNNAVKSYNAIHFTNYETQDIKGWDKKIECDYLHASTPCQAFSIAGKNKGAADSRGAELWKHTIRIIEKTKPKLITMENVKGLLQDKHKDLLNWYLDELKKLGYENKILKLNSKNYGVPQNRERVFIVSNNQDLKITEPKKHETIPRLWDLLINTNNWKTPKNGFEKDGFLYIENELNNYKGNIIEIDLKRLYKNSDGNINRVAVLKKDKYEDFKHFENDKRYSIGGTIEYSNRFIKLPYTQEERFNNPDGIARSINAVNAEFQGKILSALPFKQDAQITGIMGISPAVVTSNGEFCGKSQNARVIKWK